MTEPAIVARLWDKNQLVRSIHLTNASGASRIETMDLPSSRLRELDPSGPPSSDTILPTSVWEHRNWGPTDYLSPDEWIREYGPDTPPESAVLWRNRGEVDVPIVVIRYSDYQRVGGTY